MATPVAYGLVRGVFQCLVAAGYGAHFGTEHLHPFHVGVLAFDVERTLVYHTRHVHQCAYGGRSHTVLSGSGLGYDAFFAHLFGHKNLAYGIVYLVCTSVIEVFAFQIQPASVFLAHATCVVQRRGTAHIVAQQLYVFFLELFRFQYFQITVFEVFYRSVEYFGDICAAEFSIETSFIYLKCLFVFHIVCFCFYL